mgnify:FL=1
MRLLREYIRETLLTEAAKGIKDLQEFEFVRVIKKDGYVEFAIQFDDGSGEYHPPIGAVLIQQRRAPPACLDAWMVSHTFAKDSWGPMLYDVAMEWATEYGGGMMSDRISVSNDAYGVWDYYMKNRSDVEVEQLDLPTDSFKNGPQDDCKQSSTFKHLIKQDLDDDAWVDIPLSKVYRKPGMKTINALKAAGKFREEQGR